MKLKNIFGRIFGYILSLSMYFIASPIIYFLPGFLGNNEKDEPQDNLLVWLCIVNFFIAVIVISKLLDFTFSIGETLQSFGIIQEYSFDRMERDEAIFYLRIFTVNLIIPKIQSFLNKIKNGELYFKNNER